MNTAGSYAVILGVLGAGLAAMAYKQESHDMSLTESKVDGKRYLVRNLPDKQEAADRLADLVGRGRGHSPFGQAHQQNLDPPVRLSLRQGVLPVHGM